MIGALAKGSGRQADAIAQVNAVITDLDKATQQNAALVEETTAAAASLANESQRLAQVVGRFTLSGVNHGLAARAAPLPDVFTHRVAATLEVPEVSGFARVTAIPARAVTRRLPAPGGAKAAVASEVEDWSEF